MRDFLLALAIAIAVSPAAAQVGGPFYPDLPSRVLATIEFIEEAGIERWSVKLSGEKLSTDNAFIRIAGSSCTQIGEIHKGMITLLYEDMKFKTASGRECKVLAIER